MSTTTRRNSHPPAPPQQQQPKLTSPHTDRKDKLIADSLTVFREIVSTAAAKVDSTASAGQAAVNTMAIEILVHGLVLLPNPRPPSTTRPLIHKSTNPSQTKTTEDLLILTRRLRELWVVGPLKPAGEGDDAARESVRQDAEAVFAVMNRVRAEGRRVEGGVMEYRVGGLQGGQGAV